MRYLVSCECGEKIPVSAGQAGQAIRCTCQRSLTVPMLRELRQLPPADSLGAATSAREVAQRGGWSTLETVWFVALLATILSLAAIAIMAVVRSQLTSWTAETQAVVDASVIDRLSIEQVLAVWVEFRQAGLGEPVPNAHMYDKADADKLTQLMTWLGLLVTLPGAVITGLLSRILRRKTAA